MDTQKLAKSKPLTAQLVTDWIDLVEQYEVDKEEKEKFKQMNKFSEMKADENILKMMFAFGSSEPMSKKRKLQLLEFKEKAYKMITGKEVDLENVDEVIKFFRNRNKSIL